MFYILTLSTGSIQNLFIRTSQLSPFCSRSKIPTVATRSQQHARGDRCYLSFPPSRHDNGWVFRNLMLQRHRDKLLHILYL